MLSSTDNLRNTEASCGSSRGPSWARRCMGSAVEFLLVEVDTGHAVAHDQADDHVERGGFPGAMSGRAVPRLSPLVTSERQIPHYLARFVIFGKAADPQRAHQDDPVVVGFVLRSTLRGLMVIRTLPSPWSEGLASTRCSRMP